MCHLTVLTNYFLKDYNAIQQTQTVHKNRQISFSQIISCIKAFLQPILKVNLKLIQSVTVNMYLYNLN